MPRAWNPKPGRDMASTSRCASSFVPTMRVGKANRPAVRSRPIHRCQPRRAASSNVSANAHVSATHARDRSDCDQNEAIIRPLTPTETASRILRNSSAGVYR